MTSRACDRSWQVEAARDRRLTAAELADFAQHCQQCAACQQEQRALDALARQLREVGTHVDEMALRRLRQQTLERASQQLKRAPWRRRLTMGLALAGVAAALALWIVSKGAPGAEVAMLHVEPQRDARWHRARERDIERVELSAGTLLFRVARKAGDPRLLVRVPDGEIEDLGTIFSVTVAEGKTREIVVREGEVVFHRRDASSLHLIAGSSWQAPPEVAPVPAVHTEPAPAPPAPEPHRRRHHRVQPEPTPAAPTTDAGSAEDAAYLQILALLREGRRDEARLAAFSYLQTYPQGFRVVEVSRVAAPRDAGTPRH